MRVLDADMPVDAYPIDKDGKPHGYPYDDHPVGYRDNAVELVVGEDAGKVELRYECITWEDRPHPIVPGIRPLVTRSNVLPLVLSGWNGRLRACPCRLLVRLLRA